MELIQAIGYALSALAFLAIAFLLLTTKNIHFIKKTLLVFSLGTFIWSAIYAFLSYYGDELVPYIPHGEALKNILWLMLLTSILNSEQKHFLSPLKNQFFITFSIIYLLVPSLKFIIKLDDVLYFQLIMIMAVAASLLQLILIEQLYRKSQESQSAYKPFVLAIGAISIFDFVIFSESLLVQTIEPNHIAARAYLYFLITPLIILSIKRIKSWNLRIYVSRDIVLQSSLLMLAGIYLSLMAAVGYWIQQSGGSWSGVVKIVFGSAALLFLLSIFTSGTFRSSFKTYIAKHFFANQFDYREEWLKLTESLTAEPDKNSTYEHGLHGMLESIAYDSGAYFKVNKGELELAAKHQLNLNARQLEVLYELKHDLERTQWIIDIEDLHHKTKEYKDVNVDVSLLQEAKIQLVIPVFIKEQLNGLFLLSSNSASRAKLNWEIRDYISAISGQIARYYSFFEASKALAENAQFAAFNRMSAFIVHDLKNVVAQINLIIQNGKHFKHNPEFIDDTFETLEHTRDRMDKMLKMLMNKQQEKNAKAEVNITQAIESLLAAKFVQSQPKPTFSSAVEAKIALEHERFSHVLGHLIDNAQQACKNKGKVDIRLSQQDKYIVIEIEDTGIGMSQEFIDERLFKPFDTTKGNSGMGIGAYDAKMFAQNHQGKLLVTSKPDLGTTMSMMLPL